ncbi:pyridoxamine 5'-phosphate oxidase [Salinibacter ruber]|uniref:pyridoxamine 5'-phosphate oxidase n=1 Tax=Salinibacter ruber TaxID=146919 RepID=UPI000DDB5F33|nr:pyridoxamine 5'-phosphate oxidase [Salinibacter ruber]MCS3699718.1 pyridoxamine 5'-phosphate oxidase [Salinibacter ruber]MCS4049150.1 pyridoxamine 5'-phosphate oxidase [Salinibacter ruber]MCS4052833.1 pyridoxamine 5'-phosphate oxidase [Salinibacter ruber]
MSKLADLRQEYARAELSRDHVTDDPIEQFRAWFDEAEDAELEEPNAMTLATAATDGTPSARIVLLKGLDDRGFHFYTNYESRKGTDLSQNPHAALVFLWKPLERQVRIEGTVERLPAEESTEYFHRRPRGAQMGAWASPQSRVVDSRADLEENLDTVKAEYGDKDEIPRPSHWGGYVVRPTEVEFWQGRPNRLHDRLRYRRSDPAGDWALERLAP